MRHAARGVADSASGTEAKQAVVAAAAATTSPLKSRFDVGTGTGTKDAPVDGKDGKPHLGPWVETADGKKKGETGSSDDSDKKNRPPLKGRPEDPTIIDGVKVPQTNDGVMDDPHRTPPKEGTRGVEGGVTEKDKARKAKEGKTGERIENKPETPKEAPPLPHSEAEKLLGGDKDARKDKSATRVKDKRPDDYDEVAVGLEVSAALAVPSERRLDIGTPTGYIFINILILIYHVSRNQQTSQTALTTTLTRCRKVQTRTTLRRRRRLTRAPLAVVCTTTTTRKASSRHSTRSCCPSP